MSWEWRVFWPLKDDIDILTLLGVGQRGRSPHEVRTDVYVKCTDEVGIKWRGSKTLEIKVRLERQESGAEKWIKILHEQAPFSFNSERQHEIRQYLLSLLDKLLRKGQYQDQLVRAKTILTDTPTMSFKELKKKRYDSSIGHCCIEQTIIIHDDHTYFSVCLEGGKSNIEKLLARNLKNDKDTLKDFLISFARPCGYAEFIQSI